MGTGRHSSTMRRAIGARTPSVEVPPLGRVHQYPAPAIRGRDRVELRLTGVV
jgi:hypothetical protein